MAFLPINLVCISNSSAPPSKTMSKYTPLEDEGDYAEKCQMKRVTIN